MPAPQTKYIGDTAAYIKVRSPKQVAMLLTYGRERLHLYERLIPWPALHEAIKADLKILEDHLIKVNWVSKPSSPRSRHYPIKEE